MQIDIELVKASRQSRGWSQEHLAAVSGLGVRTIQRIESSGKASAESATALASVLEVPLVQLAAVPRTNRGMRRTRIAAIVAAATVALAYAGFMVSRANASEIGMAVVVNSDVSGESKMNIAAEEGKATPIEFAGDFRLLLTPKRVKDERVLLSLQFYSYDGVDYQLVAAPKVLLQEGIDTSLALSRGHGSPMRISVTPTKR